ncbi:Glycerol-3-phosphate dehydrogenase sdp6, mitochondrial, partial [Turnera subulata]
LTPTNGSLTHNLRLLGYYEPAVDFIARRSRLAFLGTDSAGKDFETYAKVVVNAAGPFCDTIRKMVDKDAKQMIYRSRGVHIVLPDYYPPEGMGLIVPKTKDGRVVFMHPWLGRTVAGTPDSNTIITQLPEPHEDEIILQLMSVTF